MSRGERPREASAPPWEAGVVPGTNVDGTSTVRLDRCRVGLLLAHLDDPAATCALAAKSMSMTTDWLKDIDGSGPSIE